MRSTAYTAAASCSPHQGTLSGVRLGWGSWRSEERGDSGCERTASHPGSVCLLLLLAHLGIFFYFYFLFSEKRGFEVAFPTELETHHLCANKQKAKVTAGTGPPQKPQGHGSYCSNHVQLHPTAMQL